MPAYFVLAIAIVAEVIATSALKASEGFSKIAPSIIVMIGFGVALYCLSQVLDRIPVGIAYAIWGGGGIVLITLVGWLAFGQRPDLAGFAGIALIVAGVLTLNLLSKMSAH